MRHLKEDELVQLVYGDFDCPDLEHSAKAHIDQCPACRSKMKQMQSVVDCLDSDSAVHSLRQQVEAVHGSKLPTAASAGLRWLIASLMFLLTGTGFFAGASWQSAAVNRQLEHWLESNHNHRQLNPQIQALVDRRVAGAQQSLDQRLTQVSRSVADISDRNTSQMTKMADKIESIIVTLAENQGGVTGGA